MIVADPSPTTLNNPDTPTGKWYSPGGVSTIPLAGATAVLYCPFEKCKNIIVSFGSEATLPFTELSNVKVLNLPLVLGCRIALPLESCVFSELPPKTVSEYCFWAGAAASTSLALIIVLIREINRTGITRIYGSCLRIFLSLYTSAYFTSLGSNNQYACA